MDTKTVNKQNFGCTNFVAYAAVCTGTFPTSVGFRRRNIYLPFVYLTIDINFIIAH